MIWAFPASRKVPWCDALCFDVQANKITGGEHEELMNHIMEVKLQQDVLLRGLKRVSDGQKALGESFVTEVEQIKSIQKAQGRASTERLEGLEQSTNAFLAMRKDMGTVAEEMVEDVRKHGKNAASFRAVSGMSKRLKKRPVRKADKMVSSDPEAIDAPTSAWNSGLALKMMLAYALASLGWTTVSIATGIMHYATHFS